MHLSAAKALDTFQPGLGVREYERASQMETDQQKKQKLLDKAIESHLIEGVGYFDGTTIPFQEGDKHELALMHFGKALELSTDAVQCAQIRTLIDSIKLSDAVLKDLLRTE